MTNNGLEIRANLVTATLPETGSKRFLLLLNYSRSGGQPVRIPLELLRFGVNIYERTSIADDHMRDLEWRETTEQLIYLRTDLDIVNSEDVDFDFDLIDVSD
jgi:hypothetical protein